MDEIEDKTRIDKWLWAARFYKTRSLAAEAVAGGKVQVNGERVKRAKPLQVGDEIRIRQGPYEHHVVVRELSSQRGPAARALQLYEETAQSRSAREAMALQLAVPFDQLREPAEPAQADDQEEPQHDQ